MLLSASSVSWLKRDDYGRTKDAVVMLEHNITLHPGSAFSYDGLADAALHRSKGSGRQATARDAGTQMIHQPRRARRKATQSRVLRSFGRQAAALRPQ